MRSQKKKTKHTQQADKHFSPYSGNRQSRKADNALKWSNRCPNKKKKQQHNVARHMRHTTVTLQKKVNLFLFPRSATEVKNVWKASSTGVGACGYHQVGNQPTIT
eukprot:NODE_5442_length_509_cov_52.008696_g4052_i0.p1 GENE.NODE_5442_length_509_cov_52.008696_g4052_i0~~NODE_5442_length_509_cov_52.008696_g4052_i0.p1  ORF type:complete len:105 (+),score=6.77 NODE_5442_length_509_cov_52.008696_g4052_i0:28-342(+)